MKDHEGHGLLPLTILPQPDLTTCGPTCLHAVYTYFGDRAELPTIVRETPHLRHGGTLGVMLGCHALKRGYRARIYTYNLQIFDPSWFEPTVVDIGARLRAQLRAKDDPDLRPATEAYLEYLALGGELRFRDLTSALLRKYLNRRLPIITGLSATYLYRGKRENAQMQDDDVGGRPVGHFVVLCGYDRAERHVYVADPFRPNPLSTHHIYDVAIERAMCAILLGIVTHDANLVIIQPRDSGKSQEVSHADSARRR
jgi:hypothetical protein